ncbi:YjbH domain-containing protein [Salmonirosea aquatica]|uniref:YjbH domain-containing protein n=1 Tax=Salmonirosea aquatica TaxID=2654236 RepID=A0A7C9B7V5_9BACT|nr:hypothetical protein [Cytophagaceae bacterium SJW1-29]
MAQILILQKSKGRIFLPLLFFLGMSLSGRGQVNLSGKPGLLYVPTADSTAEGTLRFGVNYNPIDYALSTTGRNAEAIAYVNLTILPRLDVNISVLKAISRPEFPVIKDVGDRQLDFRYLLLKERRLRPAVAVVMSSPFTVDAAMLTQVVVATKTFNLRGDWQALITVGLGSPYFVYRDAKVTANAHAFSSFKWQKKSEYIHDNHYLVGPFGGIRLDYRQRAGLLLESDSKHVNVGLYTRLFQRWNLQAGLINFDQVTVGTAYSFALLKPSRRLKKIYGEKR